MGCKPTEDYPEVVVFTAPGKWSHEIHGNGLPRSVWNRKGVEQSHRGLSTWFSRLTYSAAKAEFEDVFADGRPPEPSSDVLASLPSPEMAQYLVRVIDYDVDYGPFPNFCPR